MKIHENPIYFPILSLFFHLVYVFPIWFPMFPICFSHIFPVLEDSSNFSEMPVLLGPFRCALQRLHVLIIEPFRSFHDHI